MGKRRQKGKKGKRGKKREEAKEKNRKHISKMQFVIVTRITFYKYYRA